MTTEMKNIQNQPSCLIWEKDDMSSVFESVLEWMFADGRINQEMHDNLMAKLTDERLEELLGKFFTEANDSLISQINDSMYNWALYVVKDDEL